MMKTVSLKAAYEVIGNIFENPALLKNH